MRRPKNWDGYVELQASFPSELEDTSIIDIFEAGADAMLDGLKEDGIFTYGHHTPDIDDVPKVSGYWVFIEEE